MTEMTLEEALRLGIEAHKAGKVQEADKYYTAILQAQPTHPDANHNMGVLAVGVGKLDQALPFFKKAIEANPTIEQFWISFIDALIKVQKTDEAKVALSQAKNAGVKSNTLDQLQQKLGSPNKINDHLTIENLIDKAIEFRENGEGDVAHAFFREDYAEERTSFEPSRRVKSGTFLPMRVKDGNVEMFRRNL